MTSIDDQIKKAEQRGKAGFARAAELRRQKRTKLATQLGRSIIRTTKVDSLDGFNARFEVRPKGSNQPQPTPTTVSQQLTALADKMTWNGAYWHMADLPEVGKFLSQFRSDHQQDKP